MSALWKKRIGHYHIFDYLKLTQKTYKNRHQRTISFMKSIQSSIVELSNQPKPNMTKPK